MQVLGASVLGVLVLLNYKKLGAWNQKVQNEYWGFETMPLLIHQALFFILGSVATYAGIAIFVTIYFPRVNHEIINNDLSFVYTAFLFIFKNQSVLLVSTIFITIIFQFGFLLNKETKTLKSIFHLIAVNLISLICSAVSLFIISKIWCLAVGNVFIYPYFSTQTIYILNAISFFIAASTIKTIFDSIYWQNKIESSISTNHASMLFIFNVAFFSQPLILVWKEFF